MCEQAPATTSWGFPVCLPCAASLDGLNVALRDEERVRSFTADPLAGYKGHEVADPDDDLACQRCSKSFAWDDGFIAHYVGSGDHGFFYCSERCLLADEPKALAEPLREDWNA
jgi:hypothetical protein